MEPSVAIRVDHDRPHDGGPRQILDPICRRPKQPRYPSTTAAFYQIGASFQNPSNRFGLSIIPTKRRGWKLNYNTVVELSYRIFKRDNQSLFLQYYNGYV